MWTEIRRRAARMAACALIGAILAALPIAGAQAEEGAGSGAAGDALEISADQISYKGKEGVTTAEGKVVISFKTFRVTGDRAEYDSKVPCVRVKSSGKARLEESTEKTVLTAADMAFFLDEEKVDATGGVYMSYRDGSVVATGDSLSYLAREKKGVVTGNARVEMGRRVFTAGAITVLFDEQTVVATGGTRAVIPGGEAAAPGPGGGAR